MDELYDRFYDELVLWADTILNDMGEAEDLVQDFFVRLWEKKLNENLDEDGFESVETMGMYEQEELPFK